MKTEATEEEVTRAYNRGACWEWSDGKINEHGLDDENLYCLFDGSYFQGTYTLAELVDYVSCDNEEDLTSHWVSRLDRQTNNTTIQGG